jgi:hypothetical protein
MFSPIVSSEVSRALLLLQFVAYISLPLADIARVLSFSFSPFTSRPAIFIEHFIKPLFHPTAKIRGCTRTFNPKFFFSC